MSHIANKKKYFIFILLWKAVKMIYILFIFVLLYYDSYFFWPTFFDRFLNWFIKKWSKSSKLYLSFSLPFLPWNFHITMILWETFKKRYFMSLQISAHKCYWFLNSNDKIVLCCVPSYDFYNLLLNSTYQTLHFAWLGNLFNVHISNFKLLLLRYFFEQFYSVGRRGRRRRAQGKISQFLYHLTL